MQREVWDGSVVVAREAPGEASALGLTLPSPLRGRVTRCAAACMETRREMLLRSAGFATRDRRMFWAAGLSLARTVDVPPGGRQPGHADDLRRAVAFL